MIYEFEDGTKMTVSKVIPEKELVRLTKIHGPVKIKKIGSP